MVFDASRIRALVIAGSLGALFGGALPARAQEAAYLSCDQLWLQRNQIYARNGYCFNTERGRAVFGDGCFPPYGRLTGWEKRRVQELQSWERRRGC